MNRHELAWRLCGAIALLTIVSTCASAAGEDVPLQTELNPGMRVRILEADTFPSKVVGTIKGIDAQSVTIDVPGRSEPVSVAREKIARLDVSEGPRSRGIDAAIGAGIGAAIGAAGGALAGGSGNGHVVSGGEAAGIFALVGAGLGALIGAAIPPGERWHELAKTRYRVSFTPRRDHGLDLAVRWEF